MPEYRVFNYGNHFTCLSFACRIPTGWDKKLLVGLSHCIVTDKDFKWMLKLKQPRECKVMSSPPCEDGTDHSTNMFAALYLDFLQLGKNVCLAPQPGNKFTSGFTVLDIDCPDSKVVPDNKIDL
jgi:hypothetical protein